MPRAGDFQVESLGVSVETNSDVQMEGYGIAASHLNSASKLNEILAAMVRSGMNLDGTGSVTR